MIENGKSKHGKKDLTAKTRKIYAITFASIVIFGAMVLAALAIRQELKIEDIEYFYGTWNSDSKTLIFNNDGTCEIHNHSGTFEIKNRKLFINYTLVTSTVLTYDYSFSDDYNMLELTGTNSWDPEIYQKQ